MDAQMRGYFLSNGFNPDSLGGAAPVDRGMLAQAVMAQQGMPPPQQGPMGGAPPQGGYALGTFQGGPDPNAPGSMAGQYYAPSLYNSSEDRGSYDPAGGFLSGGGSGRTAWGGTTVTPENAPAGMILGNQGAILTETGQFSGQTPTAASAANSLWGGGSFAPTMAQGVPTTAQDFPSAGGGRTVGTIHAGGGYTAYGQPGGQPPGAPPSGRGAPVGTFETGPDPNAPGSTVGTPAGWGGVADPTGFGGFGAFGGFSPGMAGQGGWGGGFEGSGFNSGGDYSGGYDTAAGDVGR